MGKQAEENKFIREASCCQIRKMDGEGNDRKVELTWSSEEPYERFFGTEILDHDENAVDLKRLQEIGCVLFNHNRDNVIAKIEKVWLEDKRGKAIISFDEDDESDKIYQKVKSGTLKGVSVGYRVNTWEIVESGKKHPTRDVVGPARIATQWQPYEISIVSVPADPTVGVGRSMEEYKAKEHLENWIQRMNQNLFRR